MTNPKGTWAETEVVKFLRKNGFGTADRLAKTGAKDRGDVALAPGLMCEVKNYKSAGKRGPTPKQIELWLDQTDVETDNGGWDLGFLVVRREFVGTAGGWWAFLYAEELGQLLAAASGDHLAKVATGVTVSLTLEDLVILLRRAGWGDPL